MRPGDTELTLEQLEDLARGAGDAHDHRAYLVIGVALMPIRMCWIPGHRECAAMLVAIRAWEGRCARTGGRPWLRSFHDPGGERPCPGCASCAFAITDDQIRAMRDEARAVGDHETARCCNAALGLPVSDGAHGLVDGAAARRWVGRNYNGALEARERSAPRAVDPGAGEVRS